MITIFENIDYKNLASKLFCWAVFILAGVFAFKYLFEIFLPFLIAWIVAYVAFPLAYKLSKKTRIPRKLCSFVLVLILLLIILLILFLIGNRLLLELQKLLKYLNENTGQIAKYFENVFEFLSTITNRLPIINKLENVGLIDDVIENLNVVINKLWNSALDGLTSAIPTLAKGIVTVLPNALFVSLITIIASFYFALDLDILHKKLKSILPSHVSQNLHNMKLKINIAFKKYIKAYCILLGITFLELLVGFFVLGVDYALVLALLIALVDFLPLFGVAVILIPWGIVLLLMKNYFLGIGILVLCLLITIIRQVIEPKIVGDSLGIHPLASLVAIYVGFRLFGILGMILLPVIILIVFSKPNEEKN